MVNCPKCGTANRRGSRFCNECGELLPTHTALRCAMCGAMNPVGNAYCDQCNARIVPLSAAPSDESEREPAPIKGLSLPTIPLEKTGLDEAPLQATTPTEPAGDDWLTQLRETHVEEPAEEVALPTDTTEEGTADWLSQLRGEVIEKPLESAISPTDAPEQEPEGWLAQLRASTSDETPPDSQEPGLPVEPIAPAEIPDWLRDLGPIGVESQAQPDLEPEPEVEIPPTPDIAEVPDWLRDIAPEEAPEASVAEAATPELAEIPDWLQGLAPEEIPAPAAAAPQPVAPEATFGEGAPATPEPASIPDWLQDIAPEEAAAPEPAEVPDWLRDIAPEEAAAPEAVAPEAAALEPAEVPDWLQGLAPEEIPAPVTLEAVPAAPEPAEIPDWLQGLAPEEAPAAAAQTVAPGPTPEEAFPAAPEPAEIPDWLQGLAPAQAAPAPTASVPEGEGMPSPFVGATEPATPETPEWLREATQEGEGISSAPPPSLGEPPAEIEAAEIPDWLVDLKKRSVTPAPAFEGASESAGGIAEAGGLARAEIPAWLEALRPSAEPAAPKIEEEPAETEGLLEGLRGVLAPIPVADTFGLGEGALAAEASEAALTRAQLLQSLISQPIKVPQPKVQRRAISQWERVQRWIVAIVLLVPAVLLIWQQLGYQFGLPDPPVLAQPSALAEARTLYEVIESSNAESRVLIAFEYGAAEADELNLIAEPLLQHLAERGTIISVVSTQPEGLAVANALQNSIGPEMTFADSRYLPGNDTGIAQRLRNLEKDNARPSSIIVLAARPAPLRWWIEQTQAAYGNAAPTVVAGVSAAVEPVAVPYTRGDLAQLSAVVSGLRGAAAYEMERGEGGQATRQYNALAAGHVVVICLIIAGGILYAVEGSLRRSK